MGYPASKCVIPPTNHFMIGQAMKMETLISALEEAVSFLRESQSSMYAGLTVEEIIEKLEFEATKAKNDKPVDVKLLRLLFAPTGAIQDTAIDNKWGDEFLRISEVVDQFIVDR